MGASYEERYTVDIIDTDLFNLCRPSSLLNFLQSIAAEHVKELKIAREDLTDRCDAIWMLVRARYTLLRPIRGGETLRIKTWFPPIEKTFVYRDFDLFCGEEKVGEASNTWVLADQTAHTMLRADQLLECCREQATASDREKCGKIRMPKDLTAAGEVSMGYSYTDINGHVNNTRYADLACDAIRFDAMSGRYIRQMQISYSRECLPGESIFLRQKEEGEIRFVCGTDQEGKSHFDVRMELGRI